MSTAYRNWYRKNESGELLNPGEDTTRVCAANTEDTTFCNIM